MTRTIKTIETAINTLNAINAKDTLDALLTELGAYLAAEVGEEECGGYRFSGSARMYFTGIDGCLSAAICFNDQDAEDLGDSSGITVESSTLGNLLTRDRRDTLRALAAAGLASGEEWVEEG